MCGIVGLLTQPGSTLGSSLSNMRATLLHRGPDASGQWSDSDNGIYLAHQRLSIQDLTVAGNQPMVSACQRYVIVYNGEIYNFQSLSMQLLAKGYTFKGHSDTEVLLAAISCWGLEQALQACQGMFSFALWDKQDKSLCLVRDRLGIKPLYYGFHQGNLIFASELKAFHAIADFSPRLCHDALALFLRYSYVPSPKTIYQHIFKLKPGCYKRFQLSNLHTSTQASTYWSLVDYAKPSKTREIDSAQACIELDSLLKDAIKKRMIADVPYGAFLSGGIDSSTVAALMQAQHATPINTFSIGFENAAYNEATYAKAVAQHLGTNHHELYVSAEDALRVIPTIPHCFDEPFADASQIPTYLVAKMARQQVTVCLSGDGGDELFGGYNRHFLVKSAWHKLAKIPLSVRKLFAKSIQQLSPAQWDTVYRTMAYILPKRLSLQTPGDKLYKLAKVLPATSAYAIYQGLISQLDADDLVKEYQCQRDNIFLAPHWQCREDISERIMLMDTLHYLPDDILTKVDRTSMAVGLEARVPLLDHRIAEFAWTLPLDMKIRNGQGKWLLRQVLHQYVPKPMLERPKMGFGIPLDQWLRGPLQEWANDLLSPAKIARQGLLNNEPIQALWQAHCSGQKNHQYALWNILMFQAWQESV